MTERIEVLIAKFCSDVLTQNEAQELLSWTNQEKNIEEFNKYIALNFTIEEIKVQDENHFELWQLISKKYKIPVRKLSFWRYAAAASIVVLLAASAVLYFGSKDRATKPVLVSTEVPGTIGQDRATLTLEDGTNIDLEKGKGYTADHVESNGQSIVYGSSPEEVIAYNYLTVPKSGQFYVELSDQTKVWLNSESQLKYPKEFIKGQDRKVELLYGEAFFDVSHSRSHEGAQFKVIAKGQEISVLGTQFNVRAYNDENTIYTTLVEGKVKISNGEVTSDMNPGEQATVMKEVSSLAINQVSIYNEIAWKEGVFSFEGKTLGDIMKVISRWYDVDIIFEDKEMKKVRFVGSFTKYQSLEKILNSIKDTKFINAYEVKDQIIILK